MLPQIGVCIAVAERDKIFRMRRQPTPEQVRDHVVNERKARDWSARDASIASRRAPGAGVSNTTWSRYETTCHLTPSMETAVTVAFDWPPDWWHVLPPLSRGEMVDLTTRRLNELEQEVRSLALTVEWLMQRERRGGQRHADIGMPPAVSQ